jgi:hypothetical protein
MRDLDVFEIIHHSRPNKRTQFLKLFVSERFKKDQELATKVSCKIFWPTAASAENKELRIIIDEQTSCLSITVI